MFELATFCKHHKDDLSNRLILLSLDWPEVSNPFKESNVTEEEVGWFVNFRSRDARCFKPSDRAVVLQAVRTAWGSETAFDKYVQTELLQIFGLSKQQFCSLITTTASETLEHLLGD